MSEQRGPGNESISPTLLERIDQVCDLFEHRWKAGERPRIEEYLNTAPELERTACLRELLCVELAHRCQNGESPLVEEYCQRFPAHAQLVADMFRQAESRFEPPVDEAHLSRPTVSTGPEPAGAQEANQPARLGRYQITQTLGRGAFGVVYQGYDEELRRLVAIKVPHRRRESPAEDDETYLAEARILAGLDHPHIVPVYDVGSTDHGLRYVVYKFIEGNDLAKRIRESRPSLFEAVELVAILAEALDYAHNQGLVHRDIKPANILLDAMGKAFVADFGLALREEEYGRGSTFAGTPAYMSPEQARGEGHRVDGRSDIFSLGVVFYELLTGRRPFRAETRDDLLEQIASAEPHPPRQIESTLPRELERICLKALSKRASDRYTTARDMADDLWHFLDHASEEEKSALRSAVHVAVSVRPQAGITPPPSTIPEIEPKPIKIVPKGLRSFDANDADFFLDLLPGPRDRDGLPESIRFWKARIEEMDPDKTFAVGLLYGPSGCGKSSLVKAGLLPRLADHVIAVYIEATAEGTEPRLLRGLARSCPGLRSDRRLPETLAALRRGQGVPAGRKVLIVLDQFEQWLHAKRAEKNAELVQALRQCDGERVQCLIMVRDDFGMAAARLMGALDIRIDQGQNFATIDLFDPIHARKVLAEFGRAFGRLPENFGNLAKDQNRFLEQAVTGLSEDGRVVSIRLALFAETVKGKPWTPATLKLSGGVEGVGISFLEECFGAATANPKHREYQQASVSVLKALLPKFGAEIKGHVRSYEELLAASGYTNRLKEFDDLLRILDGELRLITPTERESSETARGVPSQAQAGQKYYQLTHDYLVPSLREWLIRKQKETPGGRTELLLAELALWQAAKPAEYRRLEETRRGRAELRLAERALLWKAKLENRYLPSWWEWVKIRLLTQRKDWTSSQGQMMRKADRYHSLRMVLLLLIGLGISFMIGNTSIYLRQLEAELGAERSTDLVDRLTVSKPELAPSIIVEWRKDTQGFSIAKLLGKNAEGRLDDAIARLQKKLGEESPPNLRGEYKAAWAERQANFAMALLLLGRGEKVWPLLKDRRDPTLRSFLIERLGLAGVDPQILTVQLDQLEVSIRRAILLSLGQFDWDRLPGARSEELVLHLLQLYQDDPDPGIHGAAEWLLRKWEADEKLREIDRVLAANKVDGQRQWYVNEQGQTMVIIARPGEFLMGSPHNEVGRNPNEDLHRRRIARPFAIAAKEVTVKQFLKFRPDHGLDLVNSPTPDCPVNVTWYDAAAYCNWLSEQEGIPPDQWCYVPNPEGKYAEGMKSADDYLQRTGYRLPTEAEWEYACRAGSETRWSFGDARELTSKYGWFRGSASSSSPVGLLKPNGLGLFDMFGNAWEWCQDVYEEKPPRGERVVEDNEVHRDVTDRTLRVLRGGSFATPPEIARSAARWRMVPTGGDHRDFGFRPARTIR